MKHYYVGRLRVNPNPKLGQYKRLAPDWRCCECAIRYICDDSGDSTPVHSCVLASEGYNWPPIGHLAYGKFAPAASVRIRGGKEEQGNSRMGGGRTSGESMVRPGLEGGGTRIWHLDWILIPLPYAGLLRSAPLIFVVKIWVTPLGQLMCNTG